MTLVPNKKLSYTLLLLVLLSSAAMASWGAPKLQASAYTGQIRNISLSVQPDMGGPGYDKFDPGTIVVIQGDMVNVSIRNLDTEGFSFSIQNYTSATIQPASNTPNGTEPVDTNIPIFNATKSGIFSFSGVGHPEMDGQFIVLPTNFSAYNPVSINRELNLLVLPDFAGDGYDKFLPGALFVNQGDNVSIHIRNFDDMPHGFSLAAFGIEQAITSGNDGSNDTIIPVETNVTTFNANTPGIYVFICTVYCGPGHQEMVGEIVVLPRQGAPNLQKPGVSYNYLTVKPDFAGDGYDKFVPGIMVANQGDLVYVKIRNTDDVTHGFALPAFNINNETIAPAQDTINGTTPTDTFVTPFVADKPGVYEFFCTVYCGPGHYQMIGYLIVLPSTTQAPSTITTSVSAGGISPNLAATVGAGMLIAGLIIGSVVLSRPRGV